MRERRNEEMEEWRNRGGMENGEKLEKYKSASTFITFSFSSFPHLLTSPYERN